MARRAEEFRDHEEQMERIRQAERRRHMEREARFRERQEEKRKAKLRQAAEKLQHQELARADAIRLQRLDSLLGLSPRDFERKVAKPYERLGFEVQLTPAVADHGVDIIAVKGAERYAIECKRFAQGTSVGRPLLQKLHSAMHVEHATKGVFITTSHFSARAIKFAEQWNIEPVGGERLCQLFASAFPVSGPADCFHVMCAECGQVMRFPLVEKLLRAKCPNGHVVLCDSRARAEPPNRQRQATGEFPKDKDPTRSRSRRRSR